MTEKSDDTAQTTYTWSNRNFSLDAPRLIVMECPPGATVELVCPNCGQRGTPAVTQCSAGTGGDDLIERLRNPMWAHSTAPFPSPQLEQEENLAAMNEAAAEIERLRAVPQTAGMTERLQCLRCGTVDAFGPVSPEKK